MKANAQPIADCLVKEVRCPKTLALEPECTAKDLRSGFTSLPACSFASKAGLPALHQIL